MIIYIMSVQIQVHLNKLISNMNIQTPITGFLRLPQIIGTSAACQGNKRKPKEIYPPLIPVSRASWWNGVKKGKYPKPIKLDIHTTVWRAEDIQEFIENAGQP